MCPLSGMLFILGLELLTQSIKHDNQIKGISLNKKSGPAEGDGLGGGGASAPTSPTLFLEILKSY